MVGLMVVAMGVAKVVSVEMVMVAAMSLAVVVAKVVAVAPRN